MKNHKNVRAAAGLAAVASLAVLGGTLAAFTDSDTTTEQVMTAGTVEVEVVEDAGWTTSMDNLAIGDTFTKTATMSNSSTLDIKGINLTSSFVDTPGAFGGNLSEAVVVDIIQDPAGAASVLATDVRLDQLADYDLVFVGDLPAGQDVDLQFAYEVVGDPAVDAGDRLAGARETTENPDNKYQGSSVTVDYTIDAIQRDGAPQG